MPAASAYCMDHSNTQNNMQTWPDLAIGLYDKLTGRGAAITYEFDNLEVWVPSAATPDANHTPWRLSGSVKVRTRDDANARA
jgi:hypothetical protein